MWCCRVIETIITVITIITIIIIVITLITNDNDTIMKTIMMCIQF